LLLEICDFNEDESLELRYCRFWHSVVWYGITTISERPLPSIFRAGDGKYSEFPRKGCTHLNAPECKVSKPRYHNTKGCKAIKRPASLNSFCVDFYKSSVLTVKDFELTSCRLSVLHKTSNLFALKFCRSATLMRRF